MKLNFDSQRLQDGNVILVIDDISKEVSKYLIDMKVQSISKADLLKMAANFEDPEDRQKVLRVVYEEFRREYSSAIREKQEKPAKSSAPLERLAEEMVRKGITVDQLKAKLGKK